jgi:hypothetical protein
MADGNTAIVVEDPEPVYERCASMDDSVSKFMLDSAPSSVRKLYCWWIVGLSLQARALVP